MQVRKGLGGCFCKGLRLESFSDTKLVNGSGMREVGGNAKVPGRTIFGGFLKVGLCQRTASVV